MYIKSIFLTTALFQNVFPANVRINDATTIFVDELHRKYPHLPSVRNIRDSNAYSELTEITNKGLRFGPEMPLINALSRLTSLEPNEICLPIITYNKRRPEIIIAVERVCNKHSHGVTRSDADAFMSQFTSIFPFNTDIFEAALDPTADRPTFTISFQHRSTKTNPKHIQLFECTLLTTPLEKSFRPIMPLSNNPHPVGINNIHHLTPLPPQPLVQRVNDWRSSTIPPNRKRTSRSRYKNRKRTPIDTTSNNVDSDTHISHNHYSQHVSGDKQRQVDNVNDKAQGRDGNGAQRGSTSSTSAAKGNGAKGGTRKKASQRKGNYENAYIIGTVIAAVIIVIGCCCCVYAAVSGKNSQPSVQRTGPNNV